VQPFADAVCLWMAHLCLRMLDAFNLQIELVFMVFWFAFVFCSPVCKNAQ
jgi:hypothetical protein